MAVSLTAGQKTGSYLDQRDNHRAARRDAAAVRSTHLHIRGFCVQISEVCESVRSRGHVGGALEVRQAHANETA